MGLFDDLKQKVESIKNSVGYFWGQTLYVIVLGLLHIGFFVFMCYLYNLINRCKNKIR